MAAGAFSYVAVFLILVIVGAAAPSPHDTPSLGNIGRPSNCLELQFMGYTSSGIYTIYPRVWYNVLPFEVYCDMKTDGGGWTVFQRRAPAEFHISFYRPWREYKQGFGNLMEEFWLGNDYLHLLTDQDHVTLRIDLEADKGNSTFATYGVFRVGNAGSNYNMTLGDFSGENETVPGDSLGYANGLIFSTYDRNDVNNCSERFKGGWWYGNCHHANLNGEYLNGIHDSYANGINWRFWSSYHYSLKWTEMKIRPQRRY